MKLFCGFVVGAGRLCFIAEHPQIDFFAEMTDLGAPLPTVSLKANAFEARRFSGFRRLVVLILSIRRETEVSNALITPIARAMVNY